MIKIFKKLSIVLGVALLMVSCSKDMDNVTPSSTLGGVSTSAAHITEIGAYSVSNLTNVNGVWTFTVQQTGEPRGNGLSHLILNLRDCDSNIVPVSAENVTEATVSGQGGTFKLTDETLELKYTEGKGTGCDMTGASGFVKYDNLNDAVSDRTVYTFTLSLSNSVNVETVDVWVKQGNSCFKGMVAGPGCPMEVGCSYSQGQLKNSDKNGLNVSGITITVGHKYTGAEAVEVMNSTVNTGGVKTAFSQAAAIRMSVALGQLNNTQSIASDLAIVESALAGINKLNGTDKPSGDISNEAKEAAGRIGAWIEENKCTLEMPAKTEPAPKK